MFKNENNLHSVIAIFGLLCSLILGCSGSDSDSSEVIELELPITAAVVDQYGIYDYLITQQYQGSVLVFEQGVELFNGGFGYENRSSGIINDSNTNFRIGSITKQFTAVAILILQERGLLSVDDFLSTYLFDFPNGDRITLKHLLNHTSGIPNYTEFDFYPSIVEQKHTTEDVLDYFKHKPLEFTPGSEFSYSNSGYVVLGAIIESISQLSYTEFLRREIFGPLDMVQSGYLDLNEYNIEMALGYVSDYNRSPFIDQTLPNADGGLASNVVDLLKWHRALQDNVLINEQTKQLMFTPYLENAALGWFVASYFDTPVYFHGGGYSGFRAGIYHYPVQNRLIVLLSNSEDTDINSLARRIDELIRN